MHSKQDFRVLIKKVMEGFGSVIVDALRLKKFVAKWNESNCQRSLAWLILIIARVG